MKRLVVTDAAKQDLRDIARYSEATWGPEKRQNYLAFLLERFAALRERPLLGRPRAEIGIHLRSLLVRQHQIFYRATEEAIVILRVLHYRMDLQAKIGPQDENKKG